MNIVVIGGTGLIGSKLVDNVRARGHEAVAASPRLGGQNHHWRGADRRGRGRERRRQRDERTIVGRRCRARVLRDISMNTSCPERPIGDGFGTSSPPLARSVLSRRALAGGVATVAGVSLVGSAVPSGVSAAAAPAGVISGDGGRAR